MTGVPPLLQIVLHWRLNLVTKSFRKQRPFGRHRRMLVYALAFDPQHPFFLRLGFGNMSIASGCVAPYSKTPGPRFTLRFRMVRVDGRERVVMNVATQSMYNPCAVSVASIFQRNRLNSVQILILIGPRPRTRFLFACSLHSTPKFGSISAEHDVGAVVDEADAVGEIPAEFEGDTAGAAATAETDGDEVEEVVGDTIITIIVVEGEAKADIEAVKETVGEGETPKLSDTVGVELGGFDGDTPKLREAVGDTEIDGVVVMVGVRVAVAVAVIVGMDGSA